MFKQFLKRFLPMPYTQTEIRLEEIKSEIRAAYVPNHPSGGGKLFSLSEPEDLWKYMSFSEFGQDRIILNCLWNYTNLNMYEIKYLDIGANHPIDNSNTYLLYIAGARGVLVEPNEKFWGPIAEMRPDDILLQCGAGYNAQTELKYYDFGDYGNGRNTFDPSTAEQGVKVVGQVKQIVTKPIMHINTIVEKYFSESCPDILCIDTEGFDTDLLMAFDYSRFQPFIIVVEDRGSEEVERFMKNAGYIRFGSSKSDTFYLNPKRVEKNRSWLGLD